MSLVDGDYIAVENKAVATLLADTGDGGLLETGSPVVSTVRRGRAELAGAMGQAEFPAVLIRVVEKRESSAPAYATVKTFVLECAAAERGMDREAAEDKVRMIAARLEKVLRRQTDTDKQFQGLPDLVDAAEGVLVSSVTRTDLPLSRVESDRVIALATVRAEVSVPCAFRYE